MWRIGCGVAGTGGSNVRPAAMSHIVTLVVLKVLATLTHGRSFNYLPSVIVMNAQVFASRRQFFWNPGDLQNGAFLQGALSIERHGRFLQAQSYTVNFATSIGRSCVGFAITGEASPLSAPWLKGSSPISHRSIWQAVNLAVVIQFLCAVLLSCRRWAL
jgi:hypothetical protein